MIALRLDPDDVDAIAERVAELIGRGALPIASERWLSTAEVAAAFGRSPEWVREHAAELGGRKIGGPRAPWRFPASCVNPRPEPAAPPHVSAVRKPRQRTRRSTVPLLPIKEQT